MIKAIVGGVWLVGGCSGQLNIATLKHRITYSSTSARRRAVSQGSALPYVRSAAANEAEFQPGSRGRVLRNLLGITHMREMEEVEARALTAVQCVALKVYGPAHRFTPADLRRLHRMWLGSIYPWAGTYRTVSVARDGFLFAQAPLIPLLMTALGKGALRRHTPCGATAGVTVARSLAEVHAELIRIHPFRDGNVRLARLLSVLMAAQAGVQSLSFRMLAGGGRQTYEQAIQVAMSRDYGPLERLFALAIE